MPCWWLLLLLLYSYVHFSNYSSFSFLLRFWSAVANYSNAMFVILNKVIKLLLYSYTYTWVVSRHISFQICIWKYFLHLFFHCVRILVQRDAGLMRDLRIMAYFRQCFPTDCNITTIKELAHALASHPPYQVPTSSIKIRHLHCQVGAIKFSLFFFPFNFPSFITIEL